VAHVRRTWIQSLLLDPCEPHEFPLCNPPEVCCTTRFGIVLVDNQVLEDKFSDRASAVRILGNVLIGFDPDVSSGPSAGDIYARLAAASGDMFVQLLKRPIDATGAAELPPDIWDTSSVIDGFSESKAKKTWWHHWNAFDTFEAGLGNGASTGNTPVFRPIFQDCTGNEVGLWGAGVSPGSVTIGSSGPD